MVIPPRLKRPDSVDPVGSGQDRCASQVGADAWFQQRIRHRPERSAEVQSATTLGTGPAWRRPRSVGLFFAQFGLVLVHADLGLIKVGLVFA